MTIRIVPNDTNREEVALQAVAIGWRGDCSLAITFRTTAQRDAAIRATVPHCGFTRCYWNHPQDQTMFIHPSAPVRVYAED